MTTRKNWWPVVIVILCVAAAIGVGIALDIVRREGWEGLWNQKKSFIEDVRPESKSLLDKAEESLRGTRPTGTN